jgi:hypothetical protein
MFDDENKNLLQQWENSDRDSKQLAHGPREKKINKRHDVPADY